MTLGANLVMTPVRETSGSTTASAYDFQNDWALCEILKLHDSGNDYCVLLEFHEDIAILDSATAPDSIQFYQVKTKTTGHWILSKLLEREKEAKLSILGKLYSNTLRFPPEAIPHIKLNLVSNAGYKLPLATSGNSLTLSIIHGIQLSTAVIDKIADQLQEEHSLSSPPQFSSFTFFLVSDLSRADSSTHTTGKLLQFLESRYPGHTISVPALYRTLMSELRRKAKHVCTATTFEELLPQKAITRAAFTDIMNNVSLLKDLNRDWDFVRLQLLHEGTPPNKVLKINRAWKACSVALTNTGNYALRSLVEEIRKSIEHQIDQDQLRLEDIVRDVAAEPAIRKLTEDLGKGSDFTQALILMQYARLHDNEQR